MLTVHKATRRGSYCYYSHFVNEEAEAYRGQVISMGHKASELVEVGFEPRV